MFASLKSKIKEETGSDLSRLTSSWRSGAFLGRIALRDDSSTTSPSSSAGPGDTTSDSISPQMHSYLSERTGGQVDQTELQQQYSAQLENKLKDRDIYWEQKLEELKLSMATVQGEEALAAQAVARTAQAEASKATSERDAATKQLNELKARLATAENAQDRLDAVTEELEQARREWARARSQLEATCGAAEGRARDLHDQLQLLRAALPPDHHQHHLHDDDKRELRPSGCAQYDRVCRERAVLARQLQEAKVALADVKTSWSGQIASLETQVARLSRQAGEEGAERRRVETEKKELDEKLFSVTSELEKVKLNLANSEAKVARLGGEVTALAQEARALRGAAGQAAELTMSLESRIERLTEENQELVQSLDTERALVRVLRERAAAGERLGDERAAEINHLNTVLADMQHDCIDLQRKFDKECREKDEALLRNAHVSQDAERSRSGERHLRAELDDARARIALLDHALAQHREDEAACMMVREAEAARVAELEELKGRVQELLDSEAALRRNVQDLETEICDKNKKIKSLDNRISDMKKTLQRELQSSKSDLTSAEEQEISRRYLKHVVLRFLTARELEARQLTRALAALLRLSAHEEAALRAALPRSGLAAWLPSLHA